MGRIPRDPALDAPLALTHDPNGPARTQRRRLGADLFETRLLLRRIICMTGPDFRGRRAFTW